MSDREVVRTVSASFVPVAVNLYEIRNDPGPSGALFRAAQRQKDQYQGIWVLAPDGKVLAAHHRPRDEQSWAAELRATTDAALRSFGAVSRRVAARDDPLKNRGRGVLPDGSVRLALSVRLTFQGKPEGEGAFDAIRLDASDWASFAPPVATPGRSWDLPGRVGRAFSRCLSPTSDQTWMPRPEEVTDAALAARVVEVSGNVARVVYVGRVAATHPVNGELSRSRALLTGIGTYDLGARTIRSLTLIAEGVYGSPPPHAEDRPIAAVVEWRSPRATASPVEGTADGG